MNGVLQVKLFSQSSEIVRVGIHVIAIPGLCGTAVAAPVVGNHAVATLPEIKHLAVPIIGGERPAMAENNRLPRAPVLVIDLGTVFYCDSRHDSLLLLSLSISDI